MFDILMPSVFEMCHKLPFPLANRVFPVLVITAKTGLTPLHDFIVVQIPVDIKFLPQALYSNGRNVLMGDKAIKRKKPVLGFVTCNHLLALLLLIIRYSVYTSIERCVLKGDHVEWTMTTASDAKGWIPMCMQKMGVPGAVVKDVGLFIDWIAKERKKQGSNSQFCSCSESITDGPVKHSRELGHSD